MLFLSQDTDQLLASLSEDDAEDLVVLGEIAEDIGRDVGLSAEAVANALLMEFENSPDEVETADSL